MRLLVATQNSGKQQEIADLLIIPGLQLCFPSDVPEVADLDVTEDGETFVQNAERKAKAFATTSNLLSVAEDTGLQVAALSGDPGVASKRWHTGSDTDRNQALLQRLVGEQNRAAKFVTVASLYYPSTGVNHMLVGEMTGTIATQNSGDAGFGYDPIFVPTGETKTLAELGIERKNAISHRAMAFTQVREYLKNHI